MYPTIKRNTFYNITVNYKKAAVETRGNFSLTIANQMLLLADAKQQKIDLFVLSTCNRTEIYGFAKHPYELINLLCKYSNGTVETFSEIATIYKAKEAVNHLFRISAGLESQILGDYEIVGQLKLAFKQAKKIGTTNTFIERLFSLVLRASKEVKNHTKLSSGTTSVSYAAIQYIKKHCTDYDTKNILVYGLGKMGMHTCKNLKAYTNNNTIKIINRSEDKVEQFVENHPDFTKALYKDLTLEISKASILIVSTSADKVIITEKHIDKNKTMLILDLSMPENVDPALKNNKNITLVNVDALSKVTDETLDYRKKEIPKADQIIEKYMQEFYEWINHRKFVPAVSALKHSLETIQHDAIDFAKKKNKTLHVEDAELVTSKMIQKITTKFVQHLKENDISMNQSINVMRSVFDVDIKVYDTEN